MIDQLVSLINESNNTVFFGGAGVSTESGIPDFRSSAGIYSHKTYPYPAEHMISADFFYAHPDQFYDFYFHEMIYPKAKANAAHRALAKLEEMGKLTAVITQNIDGLHQAAGSREVLELHGSIHRNRCIHCHAPYDLKAMLSQSHTIPKCEKCHHMLKPEVVLYGEALDNEVMERSIAYIAAADLLIVGGTSLVVYPAAGLLRYFKGKHLVLINRSQTPMDDLADVVIHESIGVVMGQVMEKLALLNNDEDMIS